MKSRVPLSALAGFVGLAAVAVALPAIAQSGVTEFRDEKTGKVWTPDNVSKDNQTVEQQARAPATSADKAFDPNRQAVTQPAVVTQRPRANLMGKVAVTAGPSVPIVTIDSPGLQAVPKQNWLSALYVTNNSAGVVEAVVGCTFTNGGRPVQETRVIIPPVGAGERWAVPVYGPRVEIFVDRVTCTVITPI